MRHCLLLLALLFSLTGCTQNKESHSIDTAKAHIQKLTDTAHRLSAAGDKKTAIVYHRKAIEHSKIAGLPEHEARSLVHIAGILKEGDAGKSLEHLYSAMDIAKRIDHKQLQSDIYLAMAEIYRQQENYTQALHALEEHHHLLDSLFARNSAQEIARVKAADRAHAERMLWMIVSGSVLLIAIVLAMYFRKVKRLNADLHHSNLVKDKLFSILAHDLRGPAANINQGLELFSSGELPPDEQKKFLDMLIKQSHAFTQTLSALLEWAKGQLQGISSRPAQFDGKSVIQKNIHVLSGQAANKQLTVLDQTPGTLPLYADQHHFDIIIRNLLSNAVKFSNKGGTIRVHAEENNGRYIFSVQDEGVGISQTRQKQLNAAGIDVSHGTAGEKGTGLGLLLVKEFAQSLGGDISLTSEENKGTTFYFSVLRHK